MLGVKRGFQGISPGQLLLADYRGRRAHTVSTSRTEALSDPSNLEFYHLYLQRSDSKGNLTLRLFQLSVSDVKVYTWESGKSAFII